MNVSSFRRRRGNSSIDFELNLASVIDCLVVLIAFVLISASFVSIGVLEGEIAASSASSSPTDSTVEMVVALKRDRSISISVVDGRTKQAYQIRPGSLKGDTAWNYEGLTDRLARIKNDWPELKSAILVADNGIAYRDVIKSMEVTRLAVPSVLLGGL